MNDFFELITRRESCRNFALREVEAEKLLRCIEAGRIAPSARNLQPWHYTVVSEKNLRASVAKTTQITGRNQFTDNAGAFIIITDTNPTIDIPMPANAKYKNFSRIDIGIATAQICLAATAQGLSSCILGTFDGDMLADLLNIAHEIRIVIAIGYAEDDKIRDKTRKSMEEIADFI